MKALLPILISGLSLAGCVAEFEWRELPEVAGAQGWLLAPAEQPDQWFADEGVSVPHFERGRLWALPVHPETLAKSTTPTFGSGNLLPVLANFIFDEGDWQAEAPNPIRIPLEPARCGEQCVLYAPCPTCVSGRGAQTCGPCTPNRPEPAVLPAKQCPPDWEGADYPDGHFECVPIAASGLRGPCPEQQRWSWNDQTCVAIAPCAPPEITPTENAIYIDASAGPGGDGRPTSPLQQIPASIVANQTIVLAPGTYSGAVELSEPGVRLVGHGLCSVLRGAAGEILSVSGVGVEVGYVWIAARDTGQAVAVSEGGQLDLHDSLLTGDVRVFASQGDVQVRRSRFTRRDSCDDDACGEQEAAVYLRGGGVLEDVDIEGPTALWGEFADLSLRNTRLMPLPDGYGLSASGPGVVAIEETTSFGGRVGMFFRADGDMQVRLTDVQIATRTSPGPMISQGVAVLGQDQFLAQVDLMRTSIESSGHGIDMNYGNINASQVRILARGRGIEAVENERIHLVSVADSWLQAGVEVIAVSGSDVFLGNSWARTCLECMLPDAVAGSVFYAQSRVQDVTPDSLEIRGAHVVAADRRVGNAFSAMEIYDLTAVSGSLYMLDSSVIEGARWDLRGRSSVFDVRERLIASDVAIRTDAPGPATCIQANAEVVINRFSVDGPAGTVPLGRENAWAGLPEQEDRWRLVQGTVPAGQLIVRSDDRCRSYEPFDISPILDRVVFVGP